MSQLLRVAVLVLPDESSPPPPQPSRPAASAIANRRRRARFNGAPVYLFAHLAQGDFRRHRPGGPGDRAARPDERRVAGRTRCQLHPLQHQRQAAAAGGVLRDLPDGPGGELRQGREGDQVLPPVPPPERRAAGICGATLLGFKCKDGKRTGVPNVQYNATAKCHKVSNPSKRVKSRYTQNT